MKEKIEKYIKTWEDRCYSTGIPDEAPQEITHKVSDYKKICIAILKNDKALKTLGFEPKKTLIYSEFKRIEIEDRNKVKQLKIF